MLSYASPWRQQEGCFVILRESSTVVAPVPGRSFFVCRITGGRRQFVYAAAMAALIMRGVSAFSVEVRDFEE